MGFLFWLLRIMAMKAVFSLFGFCLSFRIVISNHPPGESAFAMCRAYGAHGLPPLACPINLRILSAEEDIVHSPAAQRNPLLRLRRNAATFPLHAEPRLHRTKASSGLPFECGKAVVVGFALWDICLWLCVFLLYSFAPFCFFFALLWYLKYKQNGRK